jgi:hypothetical protein
MPLYPLQDARPALASPDDNGAPIAWWDGGGAFALAGSEAVRVNFRGVRLYPPGTRMRDFNGSWTGVQCNASAWALCCADVGCVLPSGAPRMPARPGLVTAGRGGLRCANGQGKELVSLGVYDISACDILDEGLDVVYGGEGRKLWHRRTALALWRYWVCVGLAIVLVRALSYNVQGLWAPAASKRQQNQRPALLAVIALLTLLVLPLDGCWDCVFVTHADQTFYWCSVGYAGYYLLHHLPACAGHEPPPVYIVLVAALQVLAMRLYTAAETPYNLVLMTMLACRAWTKALTPALHGLSLVLDALYLSLCVELAFDGTREALVAVAGVAFVAARLLALQAKG